MLWVAALPLSRLALRFGPAECFALAVFGISTMVGVASGSMLEKLVMGLLGLLLAAVGLDAITGYPRFTFGSPELLDGLSFIPELSRLLLALVTICWPLIRGRGARRLQAVAF